MTTDILSLPAAKAAIRANLGTPQNNANAAAALKGKVFAAEDAKGRKVLGTILGHLSPKGKVQAELACLTEGCTETHTREQSDWHQSLMCRTHAASTKTKLTQAEKDARAVERAKAIIAKLAPTPA